MQIGNAARLGAQMRFSNDSMIKQLINVYSELMAERKKR
jgi:hypothetical protein